MMYECYLRCLSLSALADGMPLGTLLQFPFPGSPGKAKPSAGPSNEARNYTEQRNPRPGFDEDPI